MTATLESQILDLKKSIKSIEIVLEELNQSVRSLEEAETFDVFIQKAISKYFGDSTSKNIVKILQKCRLENNFQFFTAVYQWKGIHGDLKKRQLLKIISAVYRIKYNQRKSSNYYSLRSEIKYAKACHECGQLAGVFYNRLKKEKLV